MYCDFYKLFNNKIDYEKWFSPRILLTKGFLFENLKNASKQLHDVYYQQVLFFDRRGSSFAFSIQRYTTDVAANQLNYRPCFHPILLKNTWRLLVILIIGFIMWKI